MALPSFDDTHLRQIAHILEAASTHRELTAIFQQCRIVENGGNPKWERILLALQSRQAQDGCGNNVGAFIQAIMAPVRFLNRRDDFENLRGGLNAVLSFSGFLLNEEGRLVACREAKTIDEAVERAGRLRAELVRRHVHADVLAFCRAELTQENYFHAVFEATKSVADKIRQRTGLKGDGAELVDDAFAFSKKIPLLALNSLRIETEQKEQAGFMNLVKGMFGMFRNVTAHAPKIHWKIDEQDALDLLTVVSLIHRRLDASVRTPQQAAE
ncbi:MAG: TIGR02391 family protein [Kiritimatiellae bacterium]|nr:TIGR02391 family protein [Kiritimatiellia bacterium]